MRKFRILLGAALFCVAGYNGYTAYEKANMTSEELALLENVEALTRQTESTGDLLTIYERDEFDKTCTIYVSANVELNIFGGKVVNGEGDGKIVIEGKVVCKANGTASCKPTECAELYQMIM